MSIDDLTTQEQAEAATQNWGLFHVYDSDKTRWVRTVLPIRFGPGIGAQQALNHVVAQAKFNNPLSIKALRLIAQFNSGKRNE
jgi:hypothetical protein